MSVTAEIETQYRTNALTVPLASVTTRPMKAASKTDPPGAGGTNASASATNTVANTNAAVGTNNLAGTNNGKATGTSLLPPNQPTWSSWWKATT